MIVSSIEYIVHCREKEKSSQNKFALRGEN